MQPDEDRLRAHLRSICARLHDDDGPSERRSRRERRTDDSSTDRKTLQLCAQVRRALHGIIPVPGDALFDGVEVIAVEPAPDASRLRVAVAVTPRAPAEVDRLRRRLAALTGPVRAHVAGEIHRKRVPVLMFELLPREVEP